MNIFVFDIETVPDLAAGKIVYGLENLNDTEIFEIMHAKQREKNGSDFLPLHLHKIVAISIVLRSEKNQDQPLLKVWSLGNLNSSETEILQRFYEGIERFSPTLVSWNGCGFDLPVLHYRTLICGVTAGRYWENGHGDRDFKWNNYINRYHERHTDLMDVLAGYQPRANAPLDQIAALCGFPGKMGMSGAKVWEMYQTGKLTDIRNYCETDVLNTYLVYLRFEHMRGNLTSEFYQQEINYLKAYLHHEKKPHFEEFLSHWSN